MIKKRKIDKENDKLCYHMNVLITLCNGEKEEKEEDDKEEEEAEEKEEEEP